MKLIYKLTLGFLFISLLVVLQAYIGFTGATSIQERYIQLSDETLPVMENLNSIRISGIKIVESTNEIIKTPSDNTEYIEMEINEIAKYSSSSEFL